MIRRILLSAFALFTFAAMSGPAEARVAVGTLECRSPGGFSLILAYKEYGCTFFPDWGRPYRYGGRLTSIGLQAGVTRDEVLVWRVFAPTARVEGDALRGNYAGAHAGAALVVGLGANVLVGGGPGTIMLQPVSVEAKTGVNFSLAGSVFSLH
jgi:hypothetical protein